MKIYVPINEILPMLLMHIKCYERKHSVNDGKDKTQADVLLTPTGDVEIMNDATYYRLNTVITNELTMG